MTKRWTLITVTHNSAEALRTYWAPAPADVEWIIVDNASRDDTVVAARDLGASRIVELPENLGFSAANNIGLAWAGGHYVAFVNPDVRVDYTSLSVLASTIDRHGGLVGPQLLNPDLTMQPNGRSYPTLSNKVLNRLRRDGVVNDYYVVAGPNEERSVCWLMGAAVAATKSTFESLSGWDDSYFIYYEDSDLGLRAWRRGLSVVLTGDMTWVHGWARETTTLRWQPWRNEIRSMTTFYRRYPNLLLGQRLASRTLRGTVLTPGRLADDLPSPSPAETVGQPAW